MVMQCPISERFSQDGCRIYLFVVLSSLCLLIVPVCLCSYLSPRLHYLLFCHLLWLLISSLICFTCVYQTSFVGF